MQSNFSLAVMYLGDLFIGTEGLTYVFFSFPPQWGGFISFFTLQLQL
jgi:hypothetical protein